LSINGTTILTATLRDAAGNVLTGRSVSWIIETPAVLLGVADGARFAVGGLALGESWVSASSEGIRFRALIWVTGPLTCATVAGGEIYAGTTPFAFLGSLRNEFNSNSILNTFGPYGSSSSATSIYNSFSVYGSSFGTNSAYNTVASSPPELWRNGLRVAFVSKNTIRIPRIDPDVLKTCTGWP
jgi:hypothetical protein